MIFDYGHGGIGKKFIRRTILSVSPTLLDYPVDEPYFPNIQDLIHYRILDACTASWYFPRDTFTGYLSSRTPANLPHSIFVDFEIRQVLPAYGCMHNCAPKNDSFIPSVKDIEFTFPTMN